ncbi:MAG: Tetratricopeptide repeat family protein [Chlorobi bacterium]|nr:Tetratricopeptide repeat family protein [Chlorobiota bacterium]
MRTLLVSIALCMAAYHLSTAQSDAGSTALALVNNAYAAMDTGNMDEGMGMLEEAHRIDPQSPDYLYEEAVLQYNLKDYEKARGTMRELFQHRSEGPGQWYVLLGNAYDMLGDTKTATSIYDDGLKRFPKFAVLYQERGRMALADDEYEKAVEFWENGIRADPKFPGNYYWAALLYCGSSEKIWGLIYGEIFMNLERNTGRTGQISELLYKTYQELFFFVSDSLRVSLTAHQEENVSSRGEGRKMPFIHHYVPLFRAASALVGTTRKVEMAEIDSVRRAFVDLWFADEDAREMGNVLMEWQKTLRAAGLMEAYDYWLLGEGAEAASREWGKKNPAKLTELARFMGSHHIAIDAEHYFSPE